MVESTHQVTLEDLTIRHGKSAGSSHGGGISNQGILTLNRCIVTANEAGGSGGGIENNQGALTVNHSAIVQNKSSFTGGGLYNRSGGSLTVNHSSISDNYVITNYGGGILNSGSMLNLNYSTISNNWSGSGGGLYTYNGSTANVKSSVIINNRSTISTTYDCYAATGSEITSLDYNFSATDTGCDLDFTAEHDVITSTNALLGPLVDNGGPTPSHAPLLGSPLLDRIPDGVNDCASGTSDQRGKSRPVNGACDVGAFELQSNEVANAESHLFIGTPATISGTQVIMTPTINLPDQAYALKVAAMASGDSAKEKAHVHWYVHAPGFEAGFELDLALCYQPEDISGLAESSLVPQRWDLTSATWQPYSGTFHIDTAQHCARLQGITQLSQWTLAGSVIRYVADSGDDSANTCTDSSTPCRSVQHALNQAMSGDEIRVAAGTYTTTVAPLAEITQSLSLRGGYATSNWLESLPQTQTTTLDAQTLGRVLEISGSITVTLEGFNITGGQSANGAGIYANVESLDLLHNTISANHGSGAEIHAARGNVRSNRFVGNNAASASVLILADGEFNAHNNIIANNTGSGLLLDNAGAKMQHNTLAHNSARGILVKNQGSLAITNTILVSHTTGISISADSSLLVNSLLFWNKTPITITGASGATIDTQNLYSGDPKFANPGNTDFHISEGSAAIDKGHPSALAEVTVDIDGDTRPRDTASDLGADELNVVVTYGIYLPAVTRASAN